MNLEQMKARLAAIVAKLEEYKALENFSDEQLTEINDLSAEFEGLQKNIEAQEKLQTIAAQSATSTRKTVAALPKIEVGENRKALDPKQGFAHAGEFYRAVVKHSMGSGTDPRLSFQAGMVEKIGEDGGFLIPADFRQEIQKKIQGDESLLSQTRQFLTSGNQLVLPVNETAPWSTSGSQAGVQAYWEGEAGTFTESKAKFGDMSLRLHKLTALVRTSEELLEDAPALESWIKGEAPAAMMAKLNSAIIGGSGVGMPLGILNLGFKYKVAKEGSQTADTVNFANINKMLGRLLPGSYSRAVWLVHPALMEQIRAMKFDLTSSTPIPVYMPPAGVSSAPYGTLYGRPIIPMMGAVKAVGDEGDIILADFSYYYTALKTAGVKSDVSTHVYFTTQEMAFRFSMRIAGGCPFKAPVSPENGSYDMSGIITLEDR